MNARRSAGVVMAGALIASLALAAPALTAGPGGGGGGGQPGDTTGSLYADLVIALRAVDGTPILEKYVVPETDTTKAATEYCVQPVSYEQVPGLGEGQVNPVDGRTVWVLPLQGAGIPVPQTDPPTVPDGFTGACDLEPQYAMFVSEVELERLNLVRTSDQVIADKLGDVEMKLLFAEAITLQSTGRITFDGTTIDASPENAAIYRSLMTTGTIPGLPTSMAGPPAMIGSATAEGNGQFDTWELAAAAIGAAASKGTPINVDTIEYYNRISGLTASTSVWDQVDFVQSSGSLADSEKFVDYSAIGEDGFTYNRSETFGGSVTWLDVPTLTWKVSKITDVVPFTRPDLGTDTLTGVVAFAQLADDVRAMSNFIPDNTFIPGFYVDLPGFDTTVAQQAALTEPAVDLGTLPENVFKTVPFPVTASLRNPWGGELIPAARLRLTIGMSAEVLWESTPAEVSPGDIVSTPFVVTLADTTASGESTLKLQLVTGTDTVLATDTGTITVNDNVPTVLWGDPIPKFTTQGTWATIPLRVYAPTAGATHELTLTVAGPGGAPLAEGAVTVYGQTTDAMVPMQLDLTAGKLEGTWDVPPLDPAVVGYRDVTWYASVSAAAAAGDYTFGVSLAGGNTLAPAVITVFPPESHGEQPPDVGDDTTAPVVTIAAVVIPGETATFTLTAVDENTVTFVCQLTKDGAVLFDWAPCVSPKEYPVPQDGAYVFSAQATDAVGNVSAVVTYSWVADTVLPVVTITPTLPLGSTATFTLAADEEGVTFECQLKKDGDVLYAWAVCESPKEYTYLAPGTYVFSARATDLAGNLSAEVESASWTVDPPEDITPPVVEITPTLPLGSTAIFELAADEAVQRWECRLTKNSVELYAWATCTSPKTYTALDPGTYVFSARAIDLANNTSEPVSSDPWTVGAPPDTTPPVVTITPVGTLSSTATFTLEANEPVTFECQLTRNSEVTQAWAACVSPKAYTSLKVGTYVFSARATDAAGNLSELKTYTWTVKKVVRP